MIREKGLLNFLVSKKVRKLERDSRFRRKRRKALTERFKSLTNTANGKRRIQVDNFSK